MSFSDAPWRGEREEFDHVGRNEVTRGKKKSREERDLAISIGSSFRYIESLFDSFFFYQSGVGLFMPLGLPKELINVKGLKKPFLSPQVSFSFQCRSF